MGKELHTEEELDGMKKNEEKDSAVDAPSDEETEDAALEETDGEAVKDTVSDKASKADTEIHDADSEKKKPTAKKRLITIVIVGLIIVIAVAVGFSALNNSSNSTNAESEQNMGGMNDGTDMSSMDYDNMFESQIQTLRAAIEENPSDTETLIELGGVYLMWANWTGSGSFSSAYSPDELYTNAVDYYTKAMEVDAENTEVYVSLGYAYFGWAQYTYSTTSGNLDVAGDLFEQSIQYFDIALADETLGDEDISGMTASKGVALYAMGKTDDAINLLEERRTADPDYLQILYNLGIFYETSGDIDKAIERYEAAHDGAHAAGNEDLAVAAEERLAQLQ